MQNIWCRNKCRRIQNIYDRGWSMGRVNFIVKCNEVSYLLKLATMMGMGRVMQRTPQMAQSDPTSFPPAVVGAMSPYPAHQRCVIFSQFRIHYVFNIPCPFSPPSSNDAQKASTVKWPHQLLWSKFGQILHSAVLSQVFIQFKIQSQCALRGRLSSEDSSQRCSLWTLVGQFDNWETL